MAKYDILNSEGLVVNIIEWDGVTEWTPPEGHTVTLHVEPEPVIVETPRIWTTESFRSRLTLQEKITWDNGTQPELTTVKRELETPKELEEATALVDLLVSANIISQESGDKILA